MPSRFNRVVITGRQRAGTKGFRETLSALMAFLDSRNVETRIEQETAAVLNEVSFETVAMADLDKWCDLLVVIGGDGSLLNAAHQATEHNTPVIGINRGRLGFLTDIAPTDIADKLGNVLDGQYHEEQRFLLEVEIAGHKGSKRIALNDVVLSPGTIPHMIEFDVAIDAKHVAHQRADGIIIATPTGSTAYALSGGGPIVHPHLNAIVMVPMFPHTLSSRPIVVSADSTIDLRISEHNKASPAISCDGLEQITVPIGGTISIRKKAKTLRLIHPLDYNYYETLRSKLKWESR